MAASSAPKVLCLRAHQRSKDREQAENSRCGKVGSVRALCTWWGEGHLEHTRVPSSGTVVCPSLMVVSTPCLREGSLSYVSPSKGGLPNALELEAAPRERRNKVEESSMRTRAGYHRLIPLAFCCTDRRIQTQRSCRCLRRTLIFLNIYNSLLCMQSKTGQARKSKM